MHRIATKDSVKTLALLVVGVISSIVLLILPVLVGGMVDQFGWGDKEVGWLASADMAGSALASLIALQIISRINWKKTAYIAISCAILGNITSIYADTFVSLMTVRMATGFSNGFILSIAFVGLCHSSNPERYFGAYVFSQLTFQALLLSTLPTVLLSYGMPAIYLVLATASGLSALLVFLFPDKQKRPTHAAAPAPGPPLPKWAMVALAAQAIYFLAPAAIWGYFEPIGAAFSLDIAAVGKALGLASIAGILGSAVVVMLGVRFDRILCMGLGTLISIGAVVMLIDGSGFVRYLVAASLFSFAWNYTFPYQMGVLALFDEFGSVAILALMVQLLGLAFGPMLASYLLIGDGYGVILWTCVACYLLSFAMFFFANRKHTVDLDALNET
jgi:predicted MFS family arabinose efflux permease